MGQFESTDDLRKVAGIGLSVLQKNSSILKCHKRQLHVPTSSRRVRHTDSRFVT